MPRFLNTWTGNFEWHEPRRVPYAILSHTWRSPDEGGEQSYGDIVKLQSKLKELREDSQLPPSDTLSAKPDDTTNAYPTIFSHPDLSEKIKGICEVARKAGFRLLWLDSCCINKESSAELSEAINSMYEWYRLADVCYVYLADVPDGVDPTAGDPRSPFRSSRWHRRGWTLQELLAPERVLFLTKTWRFLGTKMGLAFTLEDITGIDFDVLTGTASLDCVSVARRMSWAAQRETTRVEDRAYSLMGIFGVHLSPIYGEGHHAFIRLQEEILQRIPDQSILAWGMSCTLLSLTQGETNWRGDSTPHLLADSPSFFSSAGDIVPLSSSDFAARLKLNATDVPSIRYGLTPSGVRTHLICVDITPIPDLFDQFYEHVVGKRSDNCRAHCAHSLALLQCEDKSGSIVALPLCQLHSASKTDPGSDSDDLGTSRRVGNALESVVITTHWGCNAMSESPLHTIRLTEQALADVLRKPLSMALTKVILSHSQPDIPTPKWREWGFARRRGIAFRDSQFGVAFNLGPGCIEALCALGYNIAPLQSTRTRDELVVTTSLTSTSQRRPSGRSTPRQTIKLQLAFTNLMQEYGTTTTTFTVTSVVHNDPSAPYSTTPTLVIPDGSQRSRTDETEVVPKIYGPEGRWISQFFSESTTERVLGDAEFIVCTDFGEGTSDEPNARLLRVAVERPLKSWEVEDDRNLHIFVELSEAYTYRRTGTRAVGTSVRQPVPAQGEDSGFRNRESDPSGANVYMPARTLDDWQPMISPVRPPSTSLDNAPSRDPTRHIDTASLPPGFVPLNRQETSWGVPPGAAPYRSIPHGVSDLPLIMGPSDIPVRLRMFEPRMGSSFTNLPDYNQPDHIVHPGTEISGSSSASSGARRMNPELIDTFKIVNTLKIVRNTLHELCATVSSLSMVDSDRKMQDSALVSSEVSATLLAHARMSMELAGLLSRVHSSTAPSEGRNGAADQHHPPPPEVLLPSAFPTPSVGRMPVI